MHRSLNITSIAALSFIAAPALAYDDAKSYHGSICQMRASGNEVDAVYPGRLLSDHTGIYCDATSLGSGCPVVCPLGRDKVGDDVSLENITLELNNGPGGTFSCTAFTQQEDISGTVLDSQQFQTTTAGPRQFAWTGLLSSTDDEGSYAIECDMNYYDEIYHIYVRETTDTGAVE